MDLSLEEALADVFDDLKGEIHTALPARVERYNLASQTIDAKPTVRHEGASLPVIPNVPVAFPRGGEGYLTFPIAPGDFVFLVCSEVSLDQWRAKAGAETEPGDPRLHSLTGAVAFPCLYPSSRALADAHATAVRLGVDGGKSVAVTATGVALGSPTATDAVALASKVDEFILKIYTLFTTGWVVTPADGGAALKAAFVAAFPTPPFTAGSVVVKSE